jgi:hypothetical protein
VSTPFFFLVTERMRLSLSCHPQLSVIAQEEAIQAARRATEMLPISKDAVEGSPLVSKLALVYAWTNEPDPAFQELTMSVEIPGGIHYGELQLDPSWDPLRGDPRFDKLLAKLAPKD